MLLMPFHHVSCRRPYSNLLGRWIQAWAEEASIASKATLPLQDMGQLQAGTSGRTARATTVVRAGQENEGDMRNRQAGPSSAAPEPAQKEPEGPCPDRCAQGQPPH